MKYKLYKPIDINLNTIQYNTIQYMPIFTTINTPYDPINNNGVIRNEFDNVINKDVYQSDNIYEEIYKKLFQIYNKNETYVNISTDRAISSCTLSSLNEKYMYPVGKSFKSELKVLYIDSLIDMELNNYDEKLTNHRYRNSVVSNLLAISTDEDISRTYTKHKLPFNINQFIFLGQQEINSREENILLNSNVTYYPFNILKKNTQIFMEKVINQIDSSPVAVVFDMSVFDINISPCAIREDFKNGINIDQLNIILERLYEMNKKYNNVKMIDITGHYLSLEDTSPAFRVTIETITKIYSKIFNMKEYAINIYNENTRFLIYKPVAELCVEKENIQIEENQIEENQIEDIIELNKIGDNYGWYILRNIPKDIKEELFKEIHDDSIKIITINDNDVEIDMMISSTTIYEQNEKCYYTANSYKDCTLYPDEKISMMFELIN